MIDNIKPYLEHVKGNTYCIVTRGCRIPVYKINETDAIMIDSGPPIDWEGILALLQEEKIKITSLLISHFHIDHIGNSVNMRNQFGTKIYTSLFAAAAFANPLNFMTIASGKLTYSAIKKTKCFYMPDEIIDWTADSVTVDGVTFGIIQLPGHCAEQMGFVTPDNVAYIADQLLSNKLLESISIPYCTCPEENLKSIDKLLETDYDKYILAHNEVVDDICELAEKNRNNIFEKAAFVEQLVEGEVTKAEMVAIFLKKTGRDLNSFRKVNGITNNIAAIIGYLIDEGRLIETAKDGNIYYSRNI
ncbi:MAG: MBL fold metallo-hydrolase [Clostridia bacterium]|nr:MBL fold metallo-hydrolase [Clostridia bacterium]